MCALQAISDFLNVTSSTVSSLGLFSPDRSSDKPEWAVGRKDVEPPEYMKDFEKNTKDFMEQQAKSRSIERYDPPKSNTRKKRSLGTDTQVNIPRNKRKLSKRDISLLREKHSTIPSDMPRPDDSIQERPDLIGENLFGRVGPDACQASGYNLTGQANLFCGPYRYAWIFCKEPPYETEPPNSSYPYFIRHPVDPDKPIIFLAPSFDNEEDKLCQVLAPINGKCADRGYTPCVIPSGMPRPDDLIQERPDLITIGNLTEGAGPNKCNNASYSVETNTTGLFCGSGLRYTHPFCTPADPPGTNGRITSFYARRFDTDTQTLCMGGAGNNANCDPVDGYAPCRISSEPELPTNTTTSDDITDPTTVHPTCTQTINATQTVTKTEIVPSTQTVNYTQTFTKTDTITSACVLETVDPTETIMTSVNSPVTPTPSAIPEEPELPTENKEDDNRPFYYALGAGGLAFGWAILSTIGCAYQYITKRKAKSSNDQQEAIKPRAATISKKLFPFLVKYKPVI